MGFRLIEDTTRESGCKNTAVCGPKYRFWRGGYGGDTPPSFITLTIFNAVLATVLLALALPGMIVIALVIKLSDGGPVFYKGERLGMGKQPFNMYKFRTLPVGSQKILGADLMSYPSSANKVVTTPLTRLLRDTRIDELPQLFNVLRGDMDFFGPRPMRPEFYATNALHVKNIDLRFQVRPGLIGYSQLYTPHSTPTRIRALIDNRFVLLKRNRLWDFCVVFYTFSLLLVKVPTRGLELLWNEVIQCRLARRYNLRVMERIRSKDVRVSFFPVADPDDDRETGMVYDMSDTYFRFLTNKGLDWNREYVFLLDTYVKRRSSYRRKRLRVVGQLFKQYPSRNQNFVFDYVVMFKIETQLNAFLLDKYFLKKSII